MSDQPLVVDENATLTPGESAYIRDQGKRAFNAGTSLIHNPYAKWSHAYAQWHEGWRGEWWDTADWRPKRGT